jgi:hypothetical protein
MGIVDTHGPIRRSGKHVTQADKAHFEPSLADGSSIHLRHIHSAAINAPITPYTTPPLYSDQAALEKRHAEYAEKHALHRKNAH